MLCPTHKSSDRLNAVAADHEAARDFRYSGHRFEDKKAECGLQAADLLSWAITKVSLGSVTPSLRPFFPSIIRLASDKRERQVIYPLTGEKLVKFMQDQMRGHAEKTRMIYVEFGPRKRTLR